MNMFLIRWLMRKHKHLAGHKTRAAEALKRAARSQPDAVIHWSLGYMS
jgi:RNA-directed DNA polymerase